MVFVSRTVWVDLGPCSVCAMTFADGICKWRLLPCTQCPYTHEQITTGPVPLHGTVRAQGTLLCHLCFGAQLRRACRKLFLKAQLPSLCASWRSEAVWWVEGSLLGKETFLSFLCHTLRNTVKLVPLPHLPLVWQKCAPADKAVHKN